MSHNEKPNETDPQVIYIEQERGLSASWRRNRERARETGRKWVSNSVDADLPQGVSESLPSWAQGKKGRTRLAVLAFLVLAAWVVAVLWLIG